ncbi:MAG: hypothetical protein EOO59_08320 [Hymenobacter sp.]|nr:MAG: hypothetical protein EOO59_08320 [Hymenobacter sp.]
MGTWKGIIGASFTPDSFDQYCHLLHWLQWRPSFVALHNTAEPTLAQRPNGLTKEPIRGLESYCRDDQHWSAGNGFNIRVRPDGSAALYAAKRGA